MIMFSVLMHFNSLAFIPVNMGCQDLYVTHSFQPFKQHCYFHNLPTLLLINTKYNICTGCKIKQTFNLKEKKKAT